MTQPAPIITAPQRQPMVFASMLGCDMARLGDEAIDALAHGADALHIDIMDGRFVPNLTMGPRIVEKLREHLPDALLDVHLMVEHPEQFVSPFAEAGANHITFHIEAALGRKQHHERKVIEQIRAQGCSVGLCINPPTPAETISHVLSEVDLALVMSVFPGFGGQRFMPEVLTKARQLREQGGDRLRVQMDGGLNATTGPQAVAAGVDVLVAGTALFQAEDRQAMADALRA